MAAGVHEHHPIAAGSLFRTREVRRLSLDADRQTAAGQTDDGQRNPVSQAESMVMRFVRSWSDRCPLRMTD
jgi:hypothetical protein